jgi:NAD(P)H-dependent FMN reductase
MPTIVGIAGSLRHGSFNAGLLRNAAGAAPPGTAIDIASIAEIPLYNGDVEAAGLPTAVHALKERVAAADGLLIATPEYNSSIPGVLKNAIDWLTRPASDIKRVFGGLPVALMGATPGLGMTTASQNAWLPVLRTLGTLPWFGPRLGIPSAAKVFDGDGNLTDEATRQRVATFVAAFSEFVAKHHR